MKMARLEVLISFIFHVHEVKPVHFFKILTSFLY